MISLLGSAIQMSPPSALTRTRAYEVYVRGPVGAITDRFGSVNAYRYGFQCLAAIAEFPAPADSFNADAGFVTTGSTTLKLAAPVGDDGTIAARLFTLAADWKNKLIDLELVTRTTREDGTTVEIVNERRCAVKSSKRASNVLSLELVDLDRSALDALFPLKTYTVADFPNLFTDHVGRPVPQVVGDARKVPLTYVDNTPGAYRYLVCEILPAGPSTINTLYRQGRIVNPVEYVVDSVTVSGTSHLRVTFAKEQRDFSNNLYVLEADVFGAGSRAASDEIQRIIGLLGQTTDSASFAAASAYCLANRMVVDCGHVPQKRGTAIVQDLLLIARGQLYQTPTGAWGIFIDQPRDARASFNDGTDLIQVDEYDGPAVEKTFTLQYASSSSQKDDYLSTLQRTTSGVTGEKIFKTPYLRDNEAADRLLCYLSKKADAAATASASIYGQQFRLGAVIGIQSNVSWNGGKLFAAPQISRPADANAITLAEYVEGIYAYAANPLPAGAVNGYVPDYSQTPPDAPTGPIIVSQGSKVDTDGKVTAFLLVRAVPPLVNWAELWVQAVDDTTSEQHNQQLRLNAGNYEATLEGLRPGQPHHLIAWAINATNVAGNATVPLAFTSATNSTVPAAPATVTAAQSETKKVNYTWDRVAPGAGAAPIDTYVLEQSVNGGAFAEIFRGDALGYNTGAGIVVGNSYQGRVKVIDRNQNVSPYTTGNVLTAAKVIDDGHITPGGVSGPSIATGSINQGRQITSVGSESGTAPGGSFTPIGSGSGANYAYTPNITIGNSGSVIGTLGLLLAPTGGSTLFQFYIKNNDPGSQPYDVRYRQVAP